MKGVHHHVDRSLPAIRTGLGALCTLTDRVLRRMENDYARGEELQPGTVAAMYGTYAAHTAAFALATTRQAWPLPLRRRAARTAGTVAALAGAGIMTAGMRRFDSAAQLSGTETGTLHERGIYRYSRNPQYLGAVVSLGGVALATRSGLAALLTAGVFATYRRWIPSEERVLRQAFGDGPVDSYLKLKHEDWDAHQRHLSEFERQRTLRLVVDQDRARALGLTGAQIRQALAGTLSGVTLTAFREADRTIEVVARSVAAERTLASAVSDVNLYTPSGRFVPVSQVARVEFALEEARTWRRDRLPTITVRADVVDDVQPPDVTNALLPKLEPIRAQLPAGYYLDTGGAWHESRINEGAIQAVFPVMVLVVITLLMLQLQSFSKTAIVLLTAPLGMIGVVMALLAFHAPMGFVAQLGIIALFGMIMRNSVILVDQIRQDLEAGLDPWTATRESAVRRFRPIMLTAAAAVLAMIPLTRSELWGPMAMAIMGGLVVATVLTLLFVPALYAAWYRVRRPGETPAGAPGMEIESSSPPQMAPSAPASSGPGPQT